MYKKGNFQAFLTRKHQEFIIEALFIRTWASVWAYGCVTIAEYYILLILWPDYHRYRTPYYSIFPKMNFMKIDMFLWKRLETLENSQLLRSEFYNSREHLLVRTGDVIISDFIFHYFFSMRRWFQKFSCERYYLRINAQNVV